MSLREARIRFIDLHFHALTYPNFRYLWLGQCVSLIGTWAQTIAQAWLVLTLTGSPFLLGLVSAVQFMPFTIFSLFAGAVIDKFPKKLILICTQSISMVLAFTLALLIFTDTVTYLHVVFVAFLSGISNSFDLPTRQSFNIEVVGKEDVMNAVALNSTMLNLARIIGPTIGALMMAFFGPGWCFLLNGLSFLAVLYGLTRIRVTPYVRQRKANIGILKEIKDGIRYVLSERSLLTATLLVTIVGTFGFNFNVLIPVLTRDVLHLHEDAYGLIMSCLGVGSLIGAVTMSIQSKKGPKLTVALTCSLIVSVFLTLIGSIPSYWTVCLLIAITGFFNILFITTCNSFLQMYAEDEYRSRVMGVYSLVFVGSTPLGSLFSGYIADHYGADNAFLMCGLCSLACSLLLIYAYRKFKGSRTALRTRP